MEPDLHSASLSNRHVEAHRYIESLGNREHHNAADLEMLSVLFSMFSTEGQNSCELAQTALTSFGSLGQLVKAPAQELDEVLGQNEQLIQCIVAIKYFLDHEDLGMETKSCRRLPSSQIEPAWKEASVTGRTDFEPVRHCPKCCGYLSAAGDITSSELVGWFATDQNSTIPTSYLLDVVATLAGGQFFSTKGLGSGLLGEFGSIGGVLAADASRLHQWLEQKGEPKWFAEQLSLRLRATATLMQRVLAEGIQERTILSSCQALLDYLNISIGSEPTERFQILFLDKKNILIKDEVQQRGTVDHTPMYPREIAKRSLELGASAIIIVHNHPSGDPTPSRSDIEITKQVIAALAPLRIALHDHLIIGKSRHLSFKSEGLI